MQKILIPVDGSPSAERAVQYVIRQVRAQGLADIHLINIQPSLPGDVAAFLPKQTIADYHHEQSAKQTQSACGALDEGKIPYHLHTGVGIPAEAIVQYAREHDIDHIIMGTRGMGTVGNLVLGSVASKVIHLSDVPVTLVK
ncbi:MAG: universal stress protein [Gammaproteobacteria bacterium]